MRRTPLILFVGVLALVAEPSQAAEARAQVQKTPAIVLPIDFRVMTIAGDSIYPKPELQAKATPQLEHSLELAFARIGAFERRPLPSLSEAETATLNEHLTLIKLNVLGRVDYLDNLGDDAAPVYGIGKGLEFLAGRTGTEQLIFMFGFKIFNAGGAYSTVPAEFGGPITFSYLKNTQLYVAVVELRTGRIRWMNFQQDINADVTDPRGANAYMLPTFGNYPDSALAEPRKPKAPAPATYIKGPNGRFSVTSPAGWQHLSALALQLMFTRHGYLLDGITLRRESLSNEFAPGKKIDPDMDPVKLGELVLADLGKQGKKQIDLIRIEAATLSGRPAFCADFSTHEKLSDGDEWQSRHRLYGVAHKSGLYLVSLSAPAAVYFDEALPDFEAMVPTMKIIERN